MILRPVENQFRKFNTPGLRTLQRKTQKNKSKEKYRFLKIEMIYYTHMNCATTQKNCFVHWFYKEVTWGSICLKLQNIQDQERRQILWNMLQFNRKKLKSG